MLLAAGLLMSAVIARSALAQGPAPACADPRVRVHGTLSEPWLAAVEKLCSMLGAMGDIDASVRLRIAPSETGVQVEATVADGRVAVRDVAKPEDLALTVEALVVVPAGTAPQAPTAEPTTIASPAAPAPAPPTAMPEPVERERPQGAVTNPALPAAAAPQQARVGVEIGGGLFGRIGRAPTYLATGLELYGGWRPGPWLLGLSVRWDPIIELTKPVPYGFEMDAVGAGFEIARRALAGEVALDAGISALLLAERQSIDEGADEHTDTASDVRVGALARLLFGAAPWHWTVTLQAELSPLRVRRDLRIAPELPTLPSWGLSLGLGAAWEE